VNLWTLLGMLAIGLLGLGFGLGWFIHWLIVKFKNHGKSLLIRLPETPGTFAEVSWVALGNGKAETDSGEHDAQRGDKDANLPAGAAAYPMKGALRGPLHLLTSYGANLVAPSKLEAAATIQKEALAEWVVNYERQPRKEEEKTEGAWTKAMHAAMEEASKLATRFRVWDPLRYWKATRENDMQDLYASSGAGRDPWYAKAAFIGVLIVGVLLLGVLGVLMVKVIPALGGMAQAGP